MPAAGGNFLGFWKRFYTKNTITAGKIARRRRKIFEVWDPKNKILQWDLARRRRKKLRFGTSKFSRMGGIKVLFIYFLKNVNSYQVFSVKNVNSVSELIPTYLLVKSLIPSLKGGGN